MRFMRSAYRARRAVRDAAVRNRTCGRGYSGPVSEKGFTLIELLMVVVIIGIISGAAVPNFRGYMLNQKLNSGARELVSNMRYARFRAVSERNQWVVMFLVGGNQYIVFADDGGGMGLATSGAFVEENRGNLRPDPGERTLGPFSLPGNVVYGAVTSQNLPNGITTATAVSFGGAPPRCVFYPDGSARETGVVMLQIQERILSGDPTGQRAIVLYRPTGFARVFQYNPGGNPPWK